jgi:hypothetical protein
MLPDIINAGFEVFASVVSTLSLIAIYKAKRIVGVSPWPTVFFAVWGMWNLFYYPHLGQVWSTLAAGGMLGVNMIWLYMYYQFKE